MTGINNKPPADSNQGIEGGRGLTKSTSDRPSQAKSSGLPLPPIELVPIGSESLFENIKGRIQLIKKDNLSKKEISIFMRFFIAIASKFTNKFDTFNAKNKDNDTPPICSVLKNFPKTGISGIANGANKSDKAIIREELFAENKDNDTPLMWALSEGDTGLALAIIELAKEVLEPDDLYRLLTETKDRRDNTPLMLAAKNGFTEVASAIIQAATDGQFKRICDELTSKHSLNPNWGTKAILVNAKSQCADRLMVLLNHKNKDGDTALILAATNGYGEVAETIIKAAKDETLSADNFEAVLNAKNNDSYTPFMLAAKNGFTEVARAIILAAKHTQNTDTLKTDTLKTVLNTKHENKRSPLMWAARNGHKEMADVIIKAAKGINDKDFFKKVLTDCDMYGDTPLKLAEKGEVKEIISEALISAD